MYNAMKTTTKLSMNCETSVLPVARIQILSSPVRFLIWWKMLTSTIWASKKATSDPTIIHKLCPKTTE